MRQKGAISITSENTVQSSSVRAPKIANQVTPEVRPELPGQTDTEKNHSRSPDRDRTTCVYRFSLLLARRHRPDFLSELVALPPFALALGGGRVEVGGIAEAIFDVCDSWHKMTLPASPLGGGYNAGISLGEKSSQLVAR